MGFMLVPVLSSVRLWVAGAAFIAAATAGIFVVSMPAGASGQPGISFTGGIEARSVQTQGETFFQASSYVDYQSGTVLLAGTEDGTGSSFVDDDLVLKIVRPDGTKKTYTHDYSHHCGAGGVLPPVDLQNLFQVGINQVAVTLKDKCGGSEHATALWLRP